MVDTIKRIDRAELAKQMEKAEKLLQKGKPADALDQYLQILAQDPENDTVRQMAADLCLSLQRTPDAVRLLGELFERQMETGDATHASITYKKLSRFVNPTWEQKVRFGELMENTNRKTALEIYENALDELIKQNRKSDGLPVLRRIVQLDSNEGNFIRLGELASEAGENQEAAAAFMRLAQLAGASGASPAPWIERAYTEDPSNMQIAQEYGKSLLEQGQSGAAIFVLEPLVHAGGAPKELTETYANALLAANRFMEAEPYVWQIFERDSTKVQEIANLIGAFLDNGQDTEAVALSRKLEQSERKRGERRNFIAMMQDISANHPATEEMLEFMSELFNSANRETDYCQTLLKLFDLHVGIGNFEKAGECLDRAAEVDPYEPGHQKRLELLRGKIDEQRFKLIASRFSNATTTRPEPAKSSGEPVLGAAALQDLILQAEILVQYGMRSKAVERLQRIQELFPGEEEHNEDLQRLFLSAGVTPRKASAAAASASASASGSTPGRSPAPPPPTAPATPAAAAQNSEATDVSSLTRVAEITRKLYRQNNADAVMTTAVKEIGEQWKVSRCILAMRKPGLQPTSVKEFCDEDVTPGEQSALVQVIAAAQDVAISRGNLILTDSQSAQELQSVSDAAAKLNISSLLAVPLTDGPDQLGLLMLTHNSPRGWRSSDIVVLKTLAEQITIALNNAGLRRLVKNLSVTDEKSGLLKRASYLDLLMAEARRALQQTTPVTLLLLQFGKPSAMVRDLGEAGVEKMMQEIGHQFSSNIRQNDLAFRYGTTSIAMVLGETAEKEAFMAAEKLRKLAGNVHLPEKDGAVSFYAGIAEAVIRPAFDPVDIVTEVINRGELALDMAIAQGNGKVMALSAAFASSAVA